MLLETAARSTTPALCRPTAISETCSIGSPARRCPTMAILPARSPPSAKLIAATRMPQQPHGPVAGDHLRLRSGFAGARRLYVSQTASFGGKWSTTPANPSRPGKKWRADQLEFLNDTAFSPLRLAPRGDSGS